MVRQFTMLMVKEELRRVHGIQATVEEITRACTYYVVLEEIAKQVEFLQEQEAEGKLERIAKV